MKKINGNYTTQSQNNFPLDCEALKYIQDNRQMVEILGNIAGDKVILNGCVLNSAKTDRSPGYVFIKTKDFPDGEVLFFEGGKVAGGMYLKKSNISVTANAEPYPAAYVERTLAPGAGTESYSWTDFVILSDKTNRALMDEISALKAQIAGLAPAPIGSIQMWPSDSIPLGYMLCDGSSLNKDDYAALFSVIGTIYGGSGNTFNLPDLKGKFVACKDPGTADYSLLANTGGANKVMLGMSEIPKHNHDTVNSTMDGSITTSDEGKHTHTVKSFLGNGSTGWRHDFEYGTCNQYQAQVVPDNTDMLVLTTNGEHNHSVDLKASGGDINGATAAHENRPPFIVLNYIIKVQ